MQALLGCVTNTWQGANLVFMASLWGWEEQRPWERGWRKSVCVGAKYKLFNSYHFLSFELLLIGWKQQSLEYFGVAFDQCNKWQQSFRWCKFSYAWVESGFLVFLSACDHFRYGLRQYCQWLANFNSFQEHYDSEESGSCHAGTMQFWIVRAFFLIGWLESEAVLVLNGNLQNHLNTSLVHPANVWHH